jgi:hypothetical protein
MTIYIGKQPIEWSTPSEAAAISSNFDRLGQPQVTDKQTEEFQMDKSVTILQEEYAYCDLSQNPANVRFFATRELVSCIFIYIFNESSERLAIHCSGCTNLDWELLFNAFKHRHKFSAIIVGACVYREEYNAEAQTCMTQVIKSLITFYANNKPSFDLMITRQQTFNCNRAKEKDLPGLISVYLQSKLNEISLTVLGRPFEFPIDTKNPMKNFQDKPVPYLPGLAEGIFMNADFIIKKCTLQKESDLEMVGNLLFSNRYFNDLKKFYLLYSNAILCDFAVNLANHHFFPFCQPISQLPNSTLRQALLLNKNINPSLNHTYVFNGREQLNTFTFTKDFISFCRSQASSIRRHRELLTQNQINKELLQRFDAGDFNTQDAQKIYKQLEQRLVPIIEKFIELQNSLRTACALGDADRVAKLLQLGLIDVNAPDENNRTPLHYAVMRAPLVEQFRQANSERSLDTCLKGHPGVVRLLLTQEGIIRDPKNDNQRTPLFIATRDSDEKNTQTSPLEKQVAREIVSLFSQSARV